MTAPPRDGTAQRRPSRRRPGDSATTNPRDLPEVVRFRAAQRSVIERQVRRGELRRVRRGIYLPTTVDDDGPALRRERRVLEMAAATAETLQNDFVFSHETAALIYGLSVYRLAEEVHVTQRSKPTVRRADPHLHRHAITLPGRDRTVVGGRPVTTVERTLVDCARWLPGPRALVVADSALRAGADLDLVDVLLREAAGRPGIRQGRWVVELADARAESAAESLVRWFVLQAGLDRPDLAVPAQTDRGTYWFDLRDPAALIGRIRAALVVAVARQRTGRRPL